MGLLDFFQKGGTTNPQGDNVNPPAVPDFASIQQSYTNQSLANVSYPMANPSPYATNPAPIVPQANVTQDQAQQYPGLQNLAVPSMEPQNAVAPAPVMDMAATNMPTVNTPTVPDLQMPQATQPTQTEEKDVPSYEYVDPSKHPVLPEVKPHQGHTETMPEGIKVTTFEPVTNAPEQTVSEEADNTQVEPTTDVQNPTGEQNNLPVPDQDTANSIINEPQPEVINNFSNNSIDSQMSSNSLVGTLPVEPLETNTQSLDIPTENSMTNTTTEVNGLNSTTNNAELPVTEIQNNVVTEEVKTEPETTNNLSGLEIGVGESTLPSEQNSQTDTMQSVAEVNGPENNTEVTASAENSVSAEQMPSVPTFETGMQVAPPLMDELDSTNQSVEEISAEPITTTDLNMPVPTTVENVSETVTEQAATLIEANENPVVIPAAEAAAEAAPTATVTPINFEMSYFKTVGFIGLNSQPNSKVVEKITELSKRLSEFSEVFIIDSAKGYAKSVFESAKERGIDLTGMYLKPFHSEYSDEADLGDYDNFTVMMFSNTADKIKNIIKESDLLIMPEVFGLNNLGILFEVWSTSSMYPGQNKPIILLGKGWTAILSQLKNMFKLSDTDLSFVNVCTTTEEALAKIKELDSTLLTKEVKAPRRIIDLREEDDEEGLFI